MRGHQMKNSDIEELQKALQCNPSGLSSGQQLECESLDVILKQITFPTKGLTLHKAINEGYERINLNDFHGVFALRKYTMISDMLKALHKAHIIKDVIETAGTIYLDARPWIDNE